MTQSDFGVYAELAEQLSGLARQTGFSEHQLRLGPFRLSLCIAPDCVALGFPIAFADITLADGDAAEQTGATVDICMPTPMCTFNIYIMRLPNLAIESSLRQVLSLSSKTIQQMSKRQHTEQFVISDAERKTIRVFDQVNRIGLLAFADPMLLPPWEFFSPVKEFIHLYALNHDCLLFHGATVQPATKSATEDRTEAAIDFGRTTLMVGPGGSGKSTLTAYAIEQGMLTTGDDYVLVDLRDDIPRCHAVYRTLKLHPTSPVLRGKRSKEGTDGNTNHHASEAWHAWRTDSLTGKSVMLAQTVANGGSLIKTTTLSSIVGLSLQRSNDIFNPKAQSIVSDPSRHPYLHGSMSTIQQIPYRIDATLQLSKQLYQAIPYRALTVAPGREGLAQALATIEERFA